MIKLYFECIMTKRRIVLLTVGLLFIIIFIFLNANLFEPLHDQLINLDAYNKAYRELFTFIEVFIALIYILITFDHDEDYQHPFIALRGRTTNFLIKYGLFLLITTCFFIIVFTAYLALPVFLSHYFNYGDELLLMGVASYLLLNVLQTMTTSFVTASNKGVAFLFMLIYIVLSLLLVNSDNEALFYFVPFSKKIALKTKLGILYLAIYNVIIVLSGIIYNKYRDLT